MRENPADQDANPDLEARRGALGTHLGVARLMSAAQGLGRLVRIAPLALLLCACQRNAANGSLACLMVNPLHKQQIGSAANWDTLYRLYKIDTVHCSIDALRPMYTQRLVTLLNDGWPSLPSLAQATARDPALLDFLLDHINEQAPARELGALLNQARTQCPSGASALCEQLQWRAQAALIAQGIST